MDCVNKTLYIPLYGKAWVSRQGKILIDPWAEKIWEAEGFSLAGKSASKWLAYYMAMRARVFDRWVSRRMEDAPDAVVLHLGCGLDSRVERLGAGKNCWYDVDFPEVLHQRKRFFQENERYKMVSGDLRVPDWLKEIPGDHAIVVMEGVSMYLELSELEHFLTCLGQRFRRVELLMDCYSTLAAKGSRYRNPVREVGVERVYGMDEPQVLGKASALPFLREHEITPRELIDELSGLERRIFRMVYGGRIARRLYRLYEFRKDE